MDEPPGSGRWEHETAAGRHDHELRARVVTWSPLGLARLRCERGSVDVVQARWLPKKRRRSHGDHRYGYSSLVRAGGVPARRADQAGAASRTRSRSAHQVAKSLLIEDEVVIEATGNSCAAKAALINAPMPGMVLSDWAAALSPCKASICSSITDTCASTALN